MRVLIAGATGAIGRPLVGSLLSEGHELTALTRSESSAETLRGRDVEPISADVFDQQSVTDACLAARPDAVIVQLTALPRALNMRRYAEAIEPTNRLRAIATPHLLAGARAAGARRVIVQSISFITAPEDGLIHDESAPAYDDGPPGLREAVAATTGMERAVLAATDLEPVVLRYGQLYGPGTYYAEDGSITGEVRRRRFPIVGDGAGVSSFLHVDDAAVAARAALTGGASGLFNVTDDEPAPLHEWLPVLADAVGAKRPRRVPALVARLVAGPIAVHFATTLRGNANTRFKEHFGWRPAYRSWRDGFPEITSR